MERDEWLRWYAERGLTTLPLRPREKRPLRVGWRTPSPTAWEGAPLDANVGILCGKASDGLVVLDFDTRDGPRQVLGLRPEELAVHTLVARTARGWHVYARERGVGTSSPAEGLDVRGEGSLVVAPPSVHPTGARYAFLDTNRSIAPLSLFPLPGKAPDAPEVGIDWERAEAWVGVQSPKLREAWHRLKALPEGEFDRSRADFAVSRCLWEGGFGIEEIVAVLCALPGSKAAERGEQYARRTVDRAARARAS